MAPAARQVVRESGVRPVELEQAELGSVTLERESKGSPHSFCHRNLAGQEPMA